MNYPGAATSEPVPPPVATRNERRSRRKRDVRAQSISVKRMPKYQLALGKLLYPEDEHADIARPRTRGDCAGVPRPCPFVSCVHHLYLDVSERTGAIKLNFPDLEPDELPPTRSCVLDVAERGGATLEHVGEVMNLTRERVRQIEVRALARTPARELEDYAPGRARPVRRLPILGQ